LTKSAKSTFEEKAKKLNLRGVRWTSAAELNTVMKKIEALVGVGGPTEKPPRSPPTQNDRNSPTTCRPTLGYK
jgi:hypothetical protein